MSFLKKSLIAKPGFFLFLTKDPIICLNLFVFYKTDQKYFFRMKKKTLFCTRCKKPRVKSLVSSYITLKFLKKNCNSKYQNVIHFSTVKMMRKNVWHQKRSHRSSLKCPRSILDKGKKSQSFLVFQGKFPTFCLFPGEN